MSAETPSIVNPTKAQVLKCLKNAKYNQIRFIIDTNSNTVVMGDAETHLHSSMARGNGIAEWNGLFMAQTEEDDLYELWADIWDSKENGPRIPVDWDKCTCLHSFVFCNSGRTRRFRGYESIPDPIEAVTK